MIQQDTRSGPVAPASGGSQVSYSVINSVRDASFEVRERLFDIAKDYFIKTNKT
mgnify:CR=1 FL=1